MFSTLPRGLTALRPACEAQGYSECGPPEYRRPQGTSFAAAIASAGAALVRSAWPALRAHQVVSLLERAATDMTPETGCRRCTVDRDATSGWGRLDIAAAVSFDARRLPPIDRYETNDDAGARAWRIPNRTVNLRASVDYWDDQDDVYAVRLRRRERIVATLSRGAGNLNLVVWRPGTRRVNGLRTPTMMVTRSAGPGAFEVVRWTARRSGVHYVHVKMSEPGASRYILRIVRR